MKKAIYLIGATLLILGFVYSSKPRVIIIEPKKNLAKEKEILVFFKTSDKNFLPFPLEEIKKKLILEKTDFIEIDLQEMKAKLYKEGEIFSEFPVLAKGPYEHWGTVSVGFYRVLSKNVLAFSITEGLYMPFAINFWGKYYLHGPPYYPDGTPYTYSFSGGCIRFSNHDIKEIFNFAKIGMPILITDSGFKDDNYRYPKKESKKPPEISAESYLVADLNNGFIFLQKNSTQIYPIASITKLMSAIVVQESISLKRSILITEEMIKPFQKFSWFSPKLKIGKRYRVVELFYPALISSSNDAVEALSYFLGKEKTVKLMNEKAKSIGMFETQFFEPTGLGDLLEGKENNVSTARDLFYFAQYLLNIRPLFLKITKGEEVPSFGSISFDIQSLNNKNIFFKEPNFIGGKTGYTKSTDNTALFLFTFKTKENQNRNIAIVLLKSKDLEKDGKNILTWLKQNYFPENN